MIGTDALSVTEHGDGTKTVSGLYVSDSDATAPNDTFTIGAAANSAGGSVIPSTSGGSLTAVNAALHNGIVYDPGNDPSQTDMVTLTVSDGLGHSDTVNFVFKEAGQGPATLTGTSGKDVIFATGSDDTFIGGASADQFIFAPATEPAPTRSRISRRARTTSICGCSPKSWIPLDYHWLAARPCGAELDKPGGYPDHARR